jgi:hypothetical protein
MFLGNPQLFLQELPKNYPNCRNENMAKRDLKGWEHDYHRWAWRIKGQRVKVTCEELGLPPEKWTKEGSLDAAYAHKMKLIGQQVARREAQHPHAEHLNELKHRLQIATDLGIDTKPIEAEIEKSKTLEPDQTSYLDSSTVSKIRAAELLLGINLSEADPVSLRAFFSNDQLWNDRMKRSGRVEIGKTIGDAAKKYISGKQDESRSGTRSADGADNIRRWLQKFVAFAGELTAIDQINFDLWERWQRACKAKSKTMQTEEGAKDYGTSKAFLKWLWKQDLVTPPKNVDDKMSFTRWEAQIETYSNADIKKTVELATGQLKLHLLLMLNCGMTQKDISDLLKTQVDLQKGVIKRKRSKTKDNTKTPLVSYQLWASTLAELKTHISKHPTLALTTKSDQAWCRKETTESGKIKKADNVATLWKNLKDTNPTAEFLKTLKAFKKSSASLLRNNPRFAEFHEYFLGHSEKTIAGRNYAKLDQTTFTTAIKWLGEQYGVAKK